MLDTFDLVCDNELCTHSLLMDLIDFKIKGWSRTDLNENEILWHAKWDHFMAMWEVLTT